MAQACPINFDTVDNTIGRITSLLTTILVLFYLVSEQPLWLFLLGADLVIRLYGDKRMSPLHHTAGMLKHLLRLPTRNADGAAKQLAGLFGLLFILAMIVLTYLQWPIAAGAVAAVYIFCLLLDVVFGFCAGCKIYHLYRMFSRAQ